MRPVILCGICFLLAIAVIHIPSGDSGLARAAIGVLMYEGDHGKFPRRNSTYTSLEGATYSPSPFGPPALVSMTLHGPQKLDDTLELPQTGGTAQVDSFFDIFTEIRLSPGSPPIGFHSFFDITYLVTGSGDGDGGGSWVTEILSLEAVRPENPAAGQIEIRLRESPTLASTGQNIETRQPGDRLRIDSFFDVFTEISIDGGPYVPADSSFRLNIVPEPGSIALMLVGAAGCGLVLRRRR